MSDSFREILEEIRDKLDAVLGLGRVAARRNRSNKEEYIRSEVMQLGRLSVRDIEHRAGCSRTWALQLMERIGEEPGFTYRPGDKGRTQSGILAFDASKVVRQQHEMIVAMIREKGFASMMMLMEKFNVVLSDARSIANEFVVTHDEYMILDNNKIKKKGETSNP